MANPGEIPMALTTTAMGILMMYILLALFLQNRMVGGGYMGAGVTGYKNERFNHSLILISKS